MTTHKPMTPVRACQVAAQLLKRLDTYALIPATDKPTCYVNEEEIEALRTLHAVTARVACGFIGYRTPSERRDGTLHIPKK